MLERSLVVLVAVAGCAYSSRQSEPLQRGPASVPTAAASSPAADAMAAALAAPSSAPATWRQNDEVPPGTAQDRARAAPRSVFALGAALYLSTASGQARLLDSHYDSEESSAARRRSADGRFVAFVKHVPESELWLASTDDGQERRLLTEQADERPERNLVGFAAPQFSTDGTTIFFLAEAWATSAAVHAFELSSGVERFIVDAVDVLVIPSGPHLDQLFIERHRYKSFPGEGFHSYEWCGIVSTSARVIEVLSEDGSLCPRYAPDDRSRIEAALKIPRRGAGIP